MADQEKQCRICLDGPEVEHELGRLIRPCLCKGSISYVHVKCLQKWRNTSGSKSAFFSCPQCHYQYRFSRTRVVGLATQPVTVGVLSALLFTVLVMFASYVTTFFVAAFERPTYGSWFLYVSPVEVAQDLVAAAFRVIKDGEMSDILEDDDLGSSHSSTWLLNSHQGGFFRWFIRRFLIGLPLVGAGSLVHMLLSVQALAPVQWVARYRARNRRDNNRDAAAIIVVALLILGTIRALYKVYQFTESLTKRLLLRAEDAILEVNS